MRRQQTTVILIFLVAFNVILIFGWMRELVLEDSDGGLTVSVQRDYTGNDNVSPVPESNPLQKDLTDINDTLRTIKHIMMNDRQNNLELLELIRSNHDNSMDILHKLLQNLTRSQDLFKQQEDKKLMLSQATGTGTDTEVQVTSRLNVLIMASMRTGSSFFGEIFRQQPEFLYFFEPPKGLNLNDYDPMLTVRGVELLHDIYKCNFSGAAKVILDSLYNPVPPRAKRNVVPAWVNSDFCSGWNIKENTFAKCPTVTPEIAAKSCRHFDKVAVKEIRVFDIYPLLHLLTDPDINLRVINLIRDPRGVMSSVMPIHISNWQANKKSEVDIQLNETQLDDDLLRRLRVYCSTMLRNVLISKHAQWLPKENYMAVRYEDVSEEPIGMAQKIYSFLGMELNQNVKRWLNENTQQDADGNHAYYAWQTKRNSRETAQFWRKKMSFGLVKKIESDPDCSYLLDTMGYRKAESAEQLLNSSVSFLLPI
ncbi:carbohydrate sulfotransferase 1-like [Ptychodera flava]|uniref:carbohydrate sulfotransferase 1-like n=1 Tax=Ptychodera flava TaxID=63121 RepID=UPI003969BF2F